MRRPIALEPLESEPEVAAARRGSRAVALLVVALVLAHVGWRVYYAGDGLRPGRFWDENVNVDNARSLLESGRFAPANGFYPTLAWLPQALVLAGLEATSARFGDGEFRAFDGHRMRPQAYLAARTVSAIWSGCAIWMVFVVGRRLFSPGVGALAAALAAAVPWHIHVGAYWKPDSLVDLLLLVALDRATALARDPSWSRFLTAGAVVGLTLSSKFTGVSSALVVVAATLVAAPRPWRLLPRLAAAGAAATVLFVLINPQIDLFLRDFGWTVGDYANHAQNEGTDRVDVALGALAFPADPLASGAVQSALALAGLGALGFLAATTEAGRRRRREWALLLVHPLVFVALYSLGTPRLKGNNLVPLLPVVALLAAVALRSAYGLARRAVPLLGRRWAVAGLCLLVVAGASLRGFRYVYRSRVPTTYDVAFVKMRDRLAMRLDDPLPRLIVYERWEEPRPAWELRSWFGSTRSALVAVDSLVEWTAARLDHADAEVFPAARLEGDGETLHRHRVRRVGVRAEAIRPRPFVIRGPELVVLWHPWEAVGRAVTTIVPGSTVALPEALGAAPGDRISVTLPGANEWRDGLDLRLGERPLPLHGASRPGRRREFTLVSERLEIGGEAPLLGLGVAAPKAFPAVIWRWSSGDAAGTASP